MLVCVNCPECPGEPVCVEPCGRCCPRFRPKHQPPVRLPPPEPPNDKVKLIALTRGLFAMVDAADFELVNQYKWCASRSGRGNKFYAVRMNKGKLQGMHRFLMNPPEGMVTDHIDGNSLDNRRGNMRNCTQQQNNYSTRQRPGRSGCVGVTPNAKGDKWVARIRKDGEETYLGTFVDKQEAVRVRDRKAAELFGEFACLNPPGQARP
jgi:hypothetical protein